MNTKLKLALIDLSIFVTVCLICDFFSNSKTEHGTQKLDQKIENKNLKQITTKTDFVSKFLNFLNDELYWRHVYFGLALNMNNIVLNSIYQKQILAWLQNLIVYFLDTPNLFDSNRTKISYINQEEEIIQFNDKFKAEPSSFEKENSKWSLIRGTRTISNEINQSTRKNKRYFAYNNQKIVLVIIDDPSNFYIFNSIPRNGTFVAIESICWDKINNEFLFKCYKNVNKPIIKLHVSLFISELYKFIHP